MRASPATAVRAPRQGRRAVWLLAAAAVAAAAGLGGAFVGGRGTSAGAPWAVQEKAGREPAVAMKGRGPILQEWKTVNTPKMVKRYYRRMPHTEYTIEEIMQRIVTVLIRNMDMKWRKHPLTTIEIMKEIKLQGRQIRSRHFFNKAAYTLLGLRVIHKVTGNPMRWEISEEYREYGVPPISTNMRNPFRYAHLLKFARNRPPRYGPAHGLYQGGAPYNPAKAAERAEWRKAHLERVKKWWTKP